MHSVPLGQSSEIEHSNCENTAVDASVVDVFVVNDVSLCHSLSVMLDIVIAIAVVEASTIGFSPHTQMELQGHSM
jgi:hypothetical protein